MYENFMKLCELTLILKWFKALLSFVSMKG